MFLDRHYVVRDGEIVIVDEFTGRLSEGRKWRAGIHQAVEAQEGVEVTFATGQAARITIQDLFLRYARLAGMTGTASTSRRELSKIYRVHVVPIPTNRPPIRKQLPTKILGTTEARWEGVVEDTIEQHQLGRPVLIGTRSIDKSEQLAQLFADRGVEITVAQRPPRPPRRPRSSPRQAKWARSPSRPTWPAVVVPTSNSAKA